jgi:PAS domain-containing protein
VRALARAGTPLRLGAAAFLPLHRDGVVIGGLGIYANEIDRFDAKSQQLLFDMVSDIDAALDRLSLETAREALEDAVKASEEKFREITASTDEVIWSLDPETLRYLVCEPLRAAAAGIHGRGGDGQAVR